MDTRAALLLLIVVVGLMVLAVEIIARPPRAYAGGPPDTDEPSDPDHPAVRRSATPARADRRTPRWLAGVAQVHAPEVLPGLDEILGSERLREQFMRLVDVLGARQIDPTHPSRSLLLHGPRSTDNTRLVQALAVVSGATLVHVSARSLIPEGNATTQPLLSALVRYTTTHTPSILHIDDFEELVAPGRDSVPVRRAIHDLLWAIERRDKRAHCMVIATAAIEPFAAPASIRGVFDHVVRVPASGLPHRHDRPAQRSVPPVRDDRPRPAAALRRTDRGLAMAPRRRVHQGHAGAGAVTRRRRAMPAAPYSR